MLRVFRRSLLCFVVGVTAFGAAGWAFRPKPSWSIELHEPGFDDGEWQIHWHDEIASLPELIWLWIARSLENDGREDVIVGLDPSTGAVRRKHAFQNEFGYVLPNGQVLAIRESKSGDEPEPVYRTRFKLSDADGRLIAQRTFDGEWRHAPSGVIVWRIAETPGGIAFIVRNIASGETIHELTFPGVRKADMAVSDDARLLAVSRNARMENRQTSGIDLWDVALRQVVKRLDLPRSQNNHGPNNPTFSAERPYLHFTWSGPSTAPGKVADWIWKYESAKANDAVEFGPPASPPSDVLEPSIVDRRGNRRLWSTMNDDRVRLWFSVEHGTQVALPWREFPFPIPPIEINGPFYESFEPKCLLVPDSTELVFVAKDPPAHSLVPKSLRAWGPDSWRHEFPDDRYLWHDWVTNAWCDVGLRTDINHGLYDRTRQIRADAIITCIREGYGRSTIQSWPLPPRDPKGPALGVAALCAAGTWWACARRYRRKMNRVVIATVTA